MNILNSLPAGTILTALSLLGVTLYADSKITGSYGQSTYRPALHEHIKNIFTADDCAALIGICRIKSAYEDIIHADYCNIPDEINFEHMRNAFYPVMPGSCRDKFGGFTDMYRKFSGFMKNVSSADGEKDKNMAVISSLADIMENDTLTNMLRMKDTLSSLSPLLSAMAPNEKNTRSKKEDIREDISYMVSEDCTGSDIDDPDGEYDEILELVKMMG